MEIERHAKHLFQMDPMMRCAMLSLIYRAPPSAPETLVSTWYMCKKIITELGTTDQEIWDNVSMEIKLFGAVSLTHTCDALCQPRNSRNAEDQDRLKKEINEKGLIYSGSFKRILEQLKQVFPISFRI